MATALVTKAAREFSEGRSPDIFERAALLAERFRERAPVHDRDASFPFENFRELADAGLLSLTVPESLGGSGVGARGAARVIGQIANADPSTALVLSMHYIQHLVMTRGTHWPDHLARKLAKEAVEGIALINGLRVEPEMGSPLRGGLPVTIARRTESGWRLSGRKIYSTGAPILKWYAVWARTDEPTARLGHILVPAGLPGIRIEETWNHLGLRASGSHDVIFEDVSVPLDYEIDFRAPEEWRTPNLVHGATNNILISAIYDGVARAARDWLAKFLHERVPSNLGSSLATLPRVQEVLGAIEARLAVNARLIDGFARDFDDGIEVDASESSIIKLTVTNNAIAAVEDALSLTSNHGLSRNNPLERHFRDVLCGRVHVPQDDSIKTTAGRLALGI